jgi:hypothetical protein
MQDYWVWPRVLRALAAVLVGNAIYFLLLMPLLPPRARHEPFQIDLGLVIDFGLCLTVWGLMEMWLRRRRRAQKAG